MMSGSARSRSRSQSPTLTNQSTNSKASRRRSRSPSEKSYSDESFYSEAPRKNTKGKNNKPPPSKCSTCYMNQYRKIISITADFVLLLLSSQLSLVLLLQLLLLLFSFCIVIQSVVSEAFGNMYPLVYSPQRQKVKKKNIKYRQM